MLRTTLALVLTMLSLAVIAPGCGNGGPLPTDGTFPLDDISGTYSELGGVHHYNSTGCPQPVGTIVLTNNGTTDMELDVEETGSQIDLLVVDELGLTSPWEPTVISGGESIEVYVQFNCSSTADVSTTIVFRAGPAGTTPLEYSLPFTLDIQGAP